MKAMQYLFVLACMFAVIDLRASDTAASEDSPHSEAIRLVMKVRADEVRAAEIKALEKAENRWFDTRERTWSVKRPNGPGISDSRHYFTVIYAIDGHVVGTWSVNTQTDQVAGPNEAFRIE